MNNSRDREITALTWGLTGYGTTEASLLAATYASGAPLRVEVPMVRVTDLVGPVLKHPGGKPRFECLARGAIDVVLTNLAVCGLG